MNMISTGAFLPETDASTKQNELVKKLTAAWEKKNSKTARAGGASLMALSLAACGGEDNTPFSAADVADAEAAATTAALTAADGVTVYDSVDAAVTAGEAAASEDIVNEINTALGTSLTTADDAATIISTVQTSNDTEIAASATTAAEEAAAATAATVAEAAAAELAAANEATATAEAATAAAEAATADLQTLYDALVASNATLQTAYDALVAPVVDSLTTSNDVLSGTAGNDSFTGTTATDAAGDVIVDSSTTDNDTLTLTLTADMPAMTVTNIENVVVNTSALIGVDIDLANVTNGTTTINMTAVGNNGQVTVDNAQASNTVVAGTGITTLIADTAADGAVITAGAETTRVDVSASAASQGLTLNATSTVVDVNNIAGGGAVVADLTVNYLADTDIVIDAIGDTLVVTGDTGSMSAASSVFNGETVTNNTTGTFSVDVDVDGAHDLSGVGAARFDMTYDSNGGAVTFADEGASLQIDETFGAATTATGTASTEADNSISAVVSTAALTNFNFANYRTVTLSSDEATTITSLSIEATNNLVLTGANDITLATDVTALAIDGATATGDLDITTTAIDTVTTGAGGDTIDFDSGASQDATVTTGAGNDSVDVTDAQVDGTVTADLGTGNDSLSAGNQMTTLTVDGGDGNDTLTLAQADFTGVTMSLTGVEILSFTTGGATTLDSSIVDGNTFVLDGNSAANDVTIEMDGATLDASNLVSPSSFGITNAVTNVAGISLTVTGSDYNDILVGDDVADAISGGDGDDNINAGAGNDEIAGGAGADTLDGEGGTDTITTGAGSDDIVINTTATLALQHASRDTITDFTVGTSGDAIDYNGATANTTALTGTAALGAASSIQTHSATGNLTVNGAASLVNITVEDASTLSTDGTSVLDALVTGTGSGTITVDTAADVVLFAISDGSNTGVYLGASDTTGGADTNIAASELVLIATLNGVDNADLVVANFM